MATCGGRSLLSSAYLRAHPLPSLSEVFPYHIHIRVCCFLYRIGASPLMLREIANSSTRFFGTFLIRTSAASAEQGRKRRARLSAQCQYKDCTTARTFGREGDKQPSFCGVHKEEGMHKFEENT